MKAKAPSPPQIVIPQGKAESAYESLTYWDLNEIAGRRGFSLADLPYVETPKARQQLIGWLTEYDQRLLLPQPAGGLPVVEGETVARDLLKRALREGRHGPMCDRARCVCWKADARAALAAAIREAKGDTNA